MDELFLHIVNLEDSFWRISRDSLLLEWVKNGPVLDVGCGVGGMTKSLMKKGFDTYSIDPSRKACELVSKINSKTTCADITNVDENKFPKFKTIIMLDVLEHIEDDITALNKIHKLLDDNGRLIISVPYHKIFWTKADKNHFRRYSRKRLRTVLTATNFNVKKMRFWNMLSILPLLFSKVTGIKISHMKIAHSHLNAVLKYYFLNFENRIHIPIGSQLFCIATKAGSEG